MTPLAETQAELLPRSAERSRAAQDGLLDPIATSGSRRDRLQRRLLCVADALAIALALLVASEMGDRTDQAELLLWGALSLPVWIALFKMYGLYDRDMKRISHSTVDDVPSLFHSLVIGSLLLWAYYRVLPVEKLVLAEILAFATVALVATPIARSLVRGLTVRVLPRERVLLIGEDAIADTLARKMRTHPEYGLEPVGVVTLSHEGKPANGNGHGNGGSGGAATVLPGAGTVLTRLGSRHQLDELLDAHDIGRVVISPKGLGEAELLELLRRFKTRCLKVSVLPQMFDVLGPSVEVDDLEGVTVLGLNPPALSRSSRFLKRSMDVVGAGLLLAATAPVLLLVAVAIKLDSRGPVLFVQQRIGKGGRRFRLVKFRTMVRDAEALTQDLLRESEDPNWLKLERDPRVTRIGRLLRLSSLDELPQLLNVVKGDMSLVGPRPLIESEDALVEGWARRRLDLTPGITGYWQVLGRTNIPFAEMVKLDYLYVTNWSLWTDVRLIVRTLPAVMTRRGVN